MRTEIISLAGEEYTLTELPLKRNAAWRSQASEEFSAYADLLGEAQGIDLADTGSVGAILRKTSSMVFNAPEKIIALVFAYAPELSEVDQDAVYESELMEAFAACLRLAFPFGRLTTLLASLAQDGSVPKPMIST